MHTDQKNRENVGNEIGAAYILRFGCSNRGLVQIRVALSV